MRSFREPALLLIGVIAPAAQLILSFAPWDAGVVTGLNAVAVAAAGLLTALFLRRDELVPALTGVGQAVLVLVLGFGLAVSPDQQALYMTVVGLVVAAFVRTQVEPKAPAVG